MIPFEQKNLHLSGMRWMFLFTAIMCFCLNLSAQTDSIRKKKVVSEKKTTKKKELPVVRAESVKEHPRGKQPILQTTLPVGQPGTFQLQQPKISRNSGWVFYYLLILFLAYGVLKISYPRYFQDLLRVFFRTSLKANQIKEQLEQSTWQSLLFNGLFFLSGGFYLSLMCDYFGITLRVERPFLPVLASLLLAMIYLGKYFFLRLSGWLFQVESVTGTYVFVVFLVNKITGILLLPFLVLIAYAPAAWGSIGTGLSFVAIVGLQLYRFLLGYQAGASDSGLSRFHFFLYILAMEVSPLLLMYRVLVNVF